MNRIFGRMMVASVATSTFVMGAATAAVVPFVESFDTDAANWVDGSTGLTADYVASGGSDGGGYITTTFDPSGASDGDSVTIFRGQDEFDSSGGAFEGNYIVEGVTEYSFSVRHDSVTPLNFYTRFSGPANFPGGVAVGFVPVLANTWTKITVLIDAANPQFVSFEGMNFNAVFSNIGHIQPGLSVSSSIAGSTTPITIDIDQVSIVPEPTTAACIGLGSLALLRRRSLHRI